MMTNDEASAPSRGRAAGAGASGSPTQAGVRRIASQALFAGGRELVIDHDGREYRLRITQNGKLILTA
jgi:hemin uptake protein HemP